VRIVLNPLAHLAKVFVVTLLCSTLSGVALAADIVWKHERVNLIYQEKSLHDLLRELFAGSGRPAVISEKIKATITGRFNSPVEDFFNSLCSVFGLLTYYDGAVLYIYSSAEATSRVLALKHVSPTQLRDSLRDLDALDKRYLLRISESDRIVQVAGPPRYVDMVSDVISMLDDKVGGRQAAHDQVPVGKPLSSTFKVFSLRYAWAQDTAMTVGGKEVVIPGVASMLRRLSGNYQTIGQGNVALAAPLSSHALPNTVGKLRGGGLASQDGAALRRGVQPGSDANQGTNAGIVTPVAPGGVYQSRDAAYAQQQSALVNITLPRIEADARTNAVIVHDLPERIDRYDALISSLDVRATLIQIEASIVDVATDSLDRLGVDWSQSRTGFVVGRGNGADPGGFRAQGANLAGQAAATAANGVGGAPLTGMTTIVGNMGRYFLGQVNLLAQEGKAHVHARPSVLTVSNTEAVLENTQTFYVRLAGEREVDLFNVTAGTSLRVTPAMVEEGGQRRVKLAIRIEDGSLTGQSVDQIPVVQRSTVGTQAMVGEGQSLLIGGAAYSIDRQSNSKIPLLGDVPALGALFTFQSRQVSRVERLFMITPRIIEL
jgi:type III secretion protein C